jgi:UDP-glucose 4-epimerase/UDP-arabinose 4-epimerase
MAERILADYRSAYGFRSIALRYFNAAGADFDGELGEKRNPESHLIPRAMMALQGHLADFAVFGADFNTPDGTAVRDYIHVVDLAQAHVLALQRLLDGHDTGFYNLGSGRGYSVRQVLEKIEEITGLAVPTVSGSRQPGEPEVLVADVTLAQRELGFFSPRSDLDSIIGSAWARHLAAHPRRDTFSGSYG